MAQLSQLAIVASVHGYFNYEETTPAPRRPCNINDDSQFLDRQTSCSPLSLSLSQAGAALAQFALFFYSRLISAQK